MHRSLSPQSGEVVNNNRTILLLLICKISLHEKAVETTKQKEDKRKKPMPEEQEGMPKRQYCPPKKRRGDRNPDCHEERQKDVA
jgi:hypothetical protein